MGWMWLAVASPMFLVFASPVIILFVWLGFRDRYVDGAKDRFRIPRD